jgi:4-amino-4-deoxy-L-arabinose transferase-like glycosyltransferase
MDAQQPTPRRVPTWHHLLFALIAIALVAIALWLRLHDLGVPFDRDSYDEGVYWQTLRSMASGHALYQSTFYSQPPVFLLSVYPIYVWFGQTIWAARLGIVLVSLLGLLGAFLLGKALRGRVGAIAALLLLVANPLYLAQAQTLQAEMPCIAFSLLAVGLAYYWWKRPDGAVGMVLAGLTTLALALSILSKLFGVAALVPIGLLALARLWQIFHLPTNQRWRASASLLVGVLVFVVVTALVLLPFVGAWKQFLQSVISFHTAADRALSSSQSTNTHTIISGLLTLLALTALYGTVVALLRRDWRIVPLSGWFLASLYLLWRQVPLFPHHLVILVPPLVGLAIMGLAPIPWQQVRNGNFKNVVTIATMVAVLLILLTSAVNFANSSTYLREQHGRAMAALQSPSMHVMHDLQSVTQPGQMVLTDGQFVAAQADRSTPPGLVDTSSVRVETGYLTNQQLIQQAAQSQVHAVLFLTHRLHIPVLAPFYNWLTHNYHMVRNYGNGSSLWLKN